MGIDARMLVRRTGTPLTEAEVRRLAGRMVALLGPAGFHITTDGDEYRPAHHALSICQTVGETLAGWMRFDGEPDPDWVGHPPQAACFSQDGPPLIGGPDEQFIEVHLISRWFGIGYPRGDWPFIRSVAEVLERHIPDGAVWYGGDSGGILMTPLDAAERERLNAYFLDGGEGDYDLTGARPCPLCGDRPMPRTSAASDPVATWYCDGCARHYADDGAAPAVAAEIAPAPTGRPSWWDQLLGRPARGRLSGRRRLYRPPSGES